MGTDCLLEAPVDVYCFARGLLFFCSNCYLQLSGGTRGGCLNEYNTLGSLMRESRKPVVLFCSSHMAVWASLSFHAPLPSYRSVTFYKSNYSCAVRHFKVHAFVCKGRFNHSERCCSLWPRLSPLPTTFLKYLWVPPLPSPHKHVALLFIRFN